MTTFPAKADYATGDILTAAQMVDIGNLLNLIAPTAVGTLTNKDQSSPTNTFPYSGAWTSYAAVVAARSGAFTTASVTAYQKIIGKTCFVAGSLTITSVGTGADATVTLPFAASANAHYTGAARESGVTGQVCLLDIGTSGTTIVIWHTGASFVNGTVVPFSAYYEMA